MPPALCVPGGSGSTPGRAGRLVPPGQVVAVGGEVGGAQARVGGQPLLHLPHDAGRFQPADRGDRPRAGQVVQRGERRAIRQPRRGLHHVGQPARAAVRDRAAAPRGGRPSCSGDQRVGVGASPRELPRFGLAAPTATAARTRASGSPRRHCRAAVAVLAADDHVAGLAPRRHMCSLSLASCSM